MVRSKPTATKIILEKKKNPEKGKYEDSDSDSPHDVVDREKTKIYTKRKEQAQVKIMIKIPRTKKLSREKILEKKREAERERYQRIKNDPEKRAELQEKERLKYLRKKEQGKIKSVKDMSQKEKKLARKRWRENVAAYRRRQAEVVPKKRSSKHNEELSN